MKKLICTLLLFLLVFSCACNNAVSSKTSTTPTMQAERTLIPRQTFPPITPTPMPAYTTFCEDKNKVDTFLQFIEDHLAEKNSASSYTVSLNDTFSSNKYFYAFATLSEKDTQKVIEDKIYQFSFDGNGLRLLTSKTVNAVGKEYTYEFIYADLNGETVFYSHCGAIYAYKNNGKEIYECELSEDIDKPDYEKIRTRPTRFIFEFSNGKIITQNINNSKIILAVEGSVTIKNLTVFSGTRQLIHANIINYQVPEFYRVYKADNQQIY